MPIRHARIVTRLALDLDRLATGTLRPARSVPAARNVVLIGRVLFANGGPLTVAAIARQTGLSRATVLRRLREMQKLGTVKQVERGYCVDWDGSVRVYSLKRLRRAVALINGACSELAKLPEIF